VALARGAIGLETAPITTAASQKAAIKQLIEEHTHRSLTSKDFCPCKREVNLQRIAPDFLPTIPTFNKQKKTYF
jgi:hypothetical protein